MAPLLELDRLSVSFPARGSLFSRRRSVQAVRGVSLKMLRGEVFGLVGESGCGKSTLAQAVLGMRRPTDGRVLFGGEDLYALNADAFRAARLRMQIVFQDPFSALNPRFEVQRIIAEPMLLRGGMTREQQEARVTELLSLVGLQPEDRFRHPADFSGGQRQRIGIARAIALEPELIVLDEPVSALDVSVHAQIMNLLMDLHEARGLGYLFISHNLADVKDITASVAVMYLGSIMEMGRTREVFDKPLHPYTRCLLDAVLTLEENKSPVITKGDIPSPIDVPPGCPFFSRCPGARPLCGAEAPAQRELSPGHFVACHYPG